MATNEKIHDVFTELGIRHGLIGYRYLVDFVTGYLEGSITEIDKVTNWYHTIAKKYSVSEASVERNVRHIKDTLADHCSDVKLYRKVFGANADAHITNRDFLFALCHYFELL